VIWNEPFEFDINMKEEPSPASLQKIMVRISVRQDLPGSKDEVKLGYVDVSILLINKTLMGFLVQSFKILQDKYRYKKFPTWL